MSGLPAHLFGRWTTRPEPTTAGAVPYVRLDSRPYAAVLEAAYGQSCLENTQLRAELARLHAENARLKAFVAAVEAALPREKHEGARDACTFARDSSNNGYTDYDRGRDPR